MQLMPPTVLHMYQILTVSHLQVKLVLTVRVYGFPAG